MNKLKNVILLMAATLIAGVMFAQEQAPKSKEKSKVVKSAEGEIISEENIEAEAGATNKTMKKKPGQPKSLKLKEAALFTETEKAETTEAAIIAESEIKTEEPTVESASDDNGKPVSNNQVVPEKISNDNEIKKSTTTKPDKGVQKGKTATNKASLLKSSKNLKLKKGIVKKSKVTSVTTKKKVSKK